MLERFGNADCGDDACSEKTANVFLFMFGVGAVNWCTKKQTIIALSTEKAEYASMYLVCKESILLAQFLHQLKRVRHDRSVMTYTKSASGLEFSEEEKGNKQNKS